MEFFMRKSNTGKNMPFVGNYHTEGTMNPKCEDTTTRQLLTGRKGQGKLKGKYGSTDHTKQFSSPS